jgi:hypothetical protein
MAFNILFFAQWRNNMILTFFNPGFLPTLSLPLAILCYQRQMHNQHGLTDMALYLESSAGSKGPVTMAYWESLFF